MRKFFRGLWVSTLAVFALGAAVSYGNYTATQGAGTTFGDVIVGGVHYVQHFLCDMTTPAQCASVSAGGAVKVDGSAATQPVSAASLPLPTGAATAANLTGGGQKTQVVDGSGNVIGATSNALDVNIKSGAGSGGTAIADEATFTQGTTSFTPGGCLFNNSITNLTSGQAGAFRCTNDRTLVTTIAGATFNSNIGNNADAVAASAGSVSPVGSFGLVWNGSTWDRMPGSTTGLAVKGASGAFASGALASGAVVDITNMSATAGTAVPSKPIYLGAATGPTTGGLLTGLIQCDSKAIYDASTNGSTELVALSSGKSIYICGKTIFAGGTASVKLIYGTGTACATGSNNLTPAFPLIAQTGLVDPSPFYRGSKTAVSNALCINSSAGVAVQAEVYYTQF